METGLGPKSIMIPLKIVHRALQCALVMEFACAITFVEPQGSILVHRTRP